MCAPSNTAVDELTYRLHTQGVLGGDGLRREGLCVVRIGTVGGRRDRDKDNDNGRNRSLGGDGGDSSLSVINEVVEKLSLEYQLEARKRALRNGQGASGSLRGAGGVYQSGMDLRKQLLEKAVSWNDNVHSSKIID